jgi:hypothetical protein
MFRIITFKNNSTSYLILINQTTKTNPEYATDNMEIFLSTSYKIVLELIQTFAQ